MRNDWEDIKDNVMRRAVYLKFSQNPELKEILLGTNSKLLFEHTFRDSYWADGHPKNNSCIHGEGKNMLGKILEETRYVLGGDIIDRFKETIFEYGHWVIPGLFYVSGAPDKYHFEKMKNEYGFRYFLSLMEPQEEIDRLKIPYHNNTENSNDFCATEDDIILSRISIKDRSITSDMNAIYISITILIAIGDGLPTVLHCYGGKGRTGTIAAIVIGLLYGIKGDEALEIIGRLYKTYRPNKGRKCPKSPQTKAQFEQVRRVLDSKENWYSNFYV